MVITDRERDRQFVLEIIELIERSQKRGYVIQFTVDGGNIEFRSDKYAGLLENAMFLYENEMDMSGLGGYDKGQMLIKKDFIDGKVPMPNSVKYIVDTLEYKYNFVSKNRLKDWLGSFITEEGDKYVFECGWFYINDDILIDSSSKDLRIDQILTYNISVYDIRMDVPQEHYSDKFIEEDLVWKG